MPDNRYPTTRRFSAPTITTASTEREARRVLDWQRDVALSISASPSPPPAQRPNVASIRTYTRDPERASSYGAPPTYASRDSARLPRRDTVDSSGRYAESQVVKGMSNQALFGTILGAAAGAAFAYAMVRDREPERSGKEREPERRRVVRYSSTVEKGDRMVEVEDARPRSKVASRVIPLESDYAPRHYKKYSVVDANNEEERSEARTPGSPMSRARTHRPLALLPVAGDSTSRRSEVSKKRSEVSTVRPRMMERSMTEVMEESSWRRRTKTSTDIGDRRGMRSVPESVVPSDSVSNSGSGSRRDRSEREREWERLRIRQRFER